MRSTNFVIIFVVSILGLLSTSTTLYLYCKPNPEDQILSDKLPQTALSELVKTKRLEVIIPSKKLYFIQGNVILKEYSINVDEAPNLRIPIGDFRVEVKSRKPNWSSLSIEEQTPSGTTNDPDSRWIGFITKSNNIIYGIHGTNQSEGKSDKDIVHGCIKMGATEAKELFNLVELGEPVKIKYERIEASEQDSQIKLNIYPDLYEIQPLSIEKVVASLNKRFPNSSIDKQQVEKLITIGSGSQLVGKTHTIS